MGLIKYRLGDLIKQRREKNRDYDVPIRGVTRDGFIPPKVERVDVNTFIVFYYNDFVFNATRMELNSIVLNNVYEKGLCSPLYSMFYITKKEILLPEYLNLYLKRDEFARRCRMLGFGSAHHKVTVDDLGEIDIFLPPLPIQQKYVAIYNAMLANQRAYERGLEELKLTCDAYVERLRREMKHTAIGGYIERHDVRNSDNSIRNVKGISVYKQFRDPTSKVNTKELSNYKIVRPRQIGFVQTTHNEKVFAFAFNSTSDDIVVSSVNEVFATDEDRLLPEYLAMFFSRSEFDRYARYHSWGSARETFTWNDLREVKIPIPDIGVQQSIVDIYTAYLTRREINEKLKAQIKDICPILIKGSLEEASA